MWRRDGLRVRLIWLLVATAPSMRCQGSNFDMFNYDSTTQVAGHNSYGPVDWGQVKCQDLDQCVGWADKWETGVDWQLEENSCRWCPESGNQCGTHHQSPINLNREVADNTTDNQFMNECIDVHWMSYYDSTCSFEALKENNAFTVERHTLKVIQPIQDLGDDKYRIGCRNEFGRRWGKIDFSKGFSDWWHLSHIDFHLPSEHTQNGKRYDGELQMYHFYSVSGEVAGVNNQLAAVTVFLESYEGSQDYDVLNKIICQWRRFEEETRKDCGLPSVATEYPGCFRYTRGHDGGESISTASLNTGGRNLRSTTNRRPKATSAHDIIMHNARYNAPYNESHTPKVILMDEADYKEENDFDWDEFIGKLYEEDQADSTHRELFEYDHVGPWFNYFPLIGARTEYYYRYSGTQTIPPCYGRFVPQNNRAMTNNWRIMKDPIRISKRQLDEMHRLLRERIAPVDAPVNACSVDTAAKEHPDDPDKVWVARPLQSQHKAHHKVFCECEDWGSKFEEDKQWCRMKDKGQRFYDHPYNYKTTGF